MKINHDELNFKIKSYFKIFWKYRKYCLMAKNLFPLYDELQKLSDRNWSERDLDWRNYIPIINQMPNQFIEIVYTLIIHHYISTGTNSKKNQDITDPPYGGSKMVAKIDRGIFYRCNVLPVSLQKIIITFVRSIPIFPQ